MEILNPLERALLIAENAHRNQTYGIYPYMYHIRSVVGLAQAFGFDEKIQIACALHDVMEDSDISYNDLKTEFGAEIAEIVYAVTDENGRNRRERKQKTYPKIAAITDAVIVKVLDRIANVESSGSISDMYYKEYEEFKRKLYNKALAYEKYHKLWDYLDQIMTNGKN